MKNARKLSLVFLFFFFFIRVRLRLLLRRHQWGRLRHVLLLLGVALNFRRLGRLVAGVALLHAVPQVEIAKFAALCNS